MNFITFFNSNFFIAFITLFVGFFAIALYTHQKHEYKRNIALLIDQEIRYAENQINNSHIIMQNKYYLAYKLLPTNHWYKNINLFMRDFNESKIDKVSRFYSQVEYLDEIIKKISDYKNDIIKEKAMLNGKVVTENDINIITEIHEIKNLLTMNIQQEQAKNIQNQRENGTSGYNIQSSLPTQKVDVVILKRLMAEDILNDVSSKIEFIYNTPIGEKFREISKKKWYQIL